MAYATVTDVQARMSRTMDMDELAVCESLLNDAAIIIDAFRSSANEDVKRVVSCRMVMRALGDGSSDSGVPMGATQGSQSALGYSQSWTISAGGTGELYLSKLEKQLLGKGNLIGSYSPVQELVYSPSPEINAELSP